MGPVWALEKAARMAGSRMEDIIIASAPGDKLPTLLMSIPRTVSDDEAAAVGAADAAAGAAECGGVCDDDDDDDDAAAAAGDD